VIILKYCEKPMNDQRFDWPPLLEAPFIKELVHQMFPEVGPKRSGLNVEEAFEKHKEIASVIISSLYQAYSSPGFPNTVSIPMKNNTYKLNHQTKIPFSRARTKEVKARLSELDWISIIDAVTQEKYTRIEAKGCLKDKFDEIGLVWFPQRPLQPERSVIMRDVKRYGNGRIMRKPKTKQSEKSWVSLEQTKDVLKMQENLYQINTFLSKQCITLDLNDEQLYKLQDEVRGKDKGKELLDLRRIQLVRIFSRGSLEKGGRFYRGWWQGIPSMHRPHIRINGKKTIEVDYSGMHLRMLYALCKVDFPYDKDPYDIGLEDWVGKEDSRRKVIKKAFNAILNDEEGNYKLKAEDEKVLGLSNDEFHQKLKDTHPKIYEEIQSDIGLKLQKIDSDIAEEVLLQLTSLSIPCLPVHDSFIVSASNELLLIDLLKNAFRKHLGVDIKVDVDVVKSRESFGIPNESIRTIDPQEVIYSGGEVWKKVVVRDISLMDNYQKTYEDFFRVP
jgi:hypothetical protein